MRLAKVKKVWKIMSNKDCDGIRKCRLLVATIRLNSMKFGCIGVMYDVCSRVASTPERDNTVSPTDLDAVNTLRPKQNGHGFQKIILIAFSWQKIFLFRVKFDGRLIPSVHLTGDEPLNYWKYHWRIYVSPGLKAIKPLWYHWWYHNRLLASWCRYW